MTDSEQLIKQMAAITNTLGKMELALGVIHESIVWTNQLGIILWCNGSFDRLINRPHIEVLGSSIFDILVLSKQRVILDKEEHPIQISRLPMPPLPKIYQYAAASKILSLEIKSSLFQFHEEKPYLITVIRDVTELSVMLQELGQAKLRAEEASRLKSKFLSNMSHELRTPMNAIIGFSELIQAERAGPLTGEQKEYLGDILISARHLLQLINDILDLSKVEAGKMEFYPEPVNINKIMHEVCDILATLIAKKHLKIIIKVEPNFPTLVIDAGKLKQIFYNFISNAIKFTPEGGKIEVSTYCLAENEFRIEIKDDGIGIKKEDLDKLFIEFQQLDAGTAKKYQGTGLGLALTRRIVEAQGGQVGVHSTADKGSTFFAILPCKPHSETTVINKKVKQKSPSSLSVTTILVIEDDVKDQMHIISHLQKAGYATVIANNGKEALEKCQERHFDAITLDMILPDMNGWNILHEIRTQGLNQQTPIIIVTVMPGKVASAGFLIEDFLVKPIEPAMLIKTLERAKVMADDKSTMR